MNKFWFDGFVSKKVKYQLSSPRLNCSVLRNSVRLPLRVHLFPHNKHLRLNFSLNNFMTLSSKVLQVVFLSGD